MAVTPAEMFSPFYILSCVNLFAIFNCMEETSAQRGRKPTKPCTLIISWPAILWEGKLPFLPKVSSRQNTTFVLVHVSKCMQDAYGAGSSTETCTCRFYVHKVETCAPVYATKNAHFKSMYTRYLYSLESER